MRLRFFRTGGLVKARGLCAVLSVKLKPNQSLLLRGIIMNTRHLSNDTVENFNVYRSQVQAADALYKQGNIVGARTAFDKIVGNLEAKQAMITTADEKKLLADAYMGRGLAYMLGSAVHGPQALADFDRTIQLDPSNQLAVQKKKELQFELGITQ
jgi:hypothetical protein